MSSTPPYSPIYPRLPLEEDQRNYLRQVVDILLRQSALLLLILLGLIMYSPRHPGGDRNSSFRCYPCGPECEYRSENDSWQPD